MTTFAETLKTYADGQRSLEPFPQEMGFYGMVPPQRSGTGELTKGDVLTAQWVNAIFRDCFRAQQQIQEFAIPDSVSLTTPAHGRIGPLIWLTFRTNNTLAPGGIVQWPNSYRFKTPPLVLPLNLFTSAAHRVVVYNVTKSGFQMRAATSSSTENVTDFGGFNDFIVIGETEGAVPVKPEMGMFAEYERTYPDGQTTWTAPSADQYSTGFVPTHVNAAGQQVSGDQLSANVLNFVLCDLFRKGGRGTATVKNHIDDVTKALSTTPAYIIQAGPFKIQMWRDKVLQGGDRLQFPEPFRKGSTPVIFASYDSLKGGDPVGSLGFVSVAANTNDPNNVNAWTGRVTAWTNASAPTSIDADVVMIAIGFADRPVSLQRYYTDFAATAKTYPDGQTNTVTIPAATMASGFKPPVRNADGSITPGDPVTAQDINSLFKLAYADAATGLNKMSGLLVESIVSNGWSMLENSKYFMAWRYFDNAPWTSTGEFAFTPPTSIKNGSTIITFAADTADSDPALITMNSSSAGNGVLLKAVKQSSLTTAAKPKRFGVFMLGVKA